MYLVDISLTHHNIIPPKNHRYVWHGSLLEESIRSIFRIWNPEEDCGYHGVTSTRWISDLCLISWINPVPPIEILANNCLLEFKSSQTRLWKSLCTVFLKIINFPFTATDNSWYRKARSQFTYSRKAKMNYPVAEQ